MQKNNSYLIKICIAAILTAAGFLLDRVLTISTPAVKINLAFLPAVFAAVLLGPLWGACVYALTDLTGALLLPFGVYHPGFTVCAGIMGAVYGVFLFGKEKVSFFKNILPPVLINCLIIGLFINTAWISMLYDSKTYWGFFLSRVIEYAVLVPVQLALIPAVLKLAPDLKRQLKLL